MLNTKQEWKKKNDEEEDREGPRRLKEKGRRRGQREEEKKLGDSSTAFACGKSVGTVRCKVNGPESPGLVCLLTTLGRSERWHRTYLLSSFPYAWKREIRTSHRDTWQTLDKRKNRISKFKFAKYRTLIFPPIKIWTLSLPMCANSSILSKIFWAKANCKKDYILCTF